MEMMSKGYMYILECSDGTFYTGSTKNLERRLYEHQGINSDEKGANYTKARRPVELVYYEEYERIDEAFYREKQVQNWSHKKKLALIEGKTGLLPLLAKKVFAKHCSAVSPPFGRQARYSSRQARGTRRPGRDQYKYIIKGCRVSGGSRVYRGNQRNN